MIDLVLCMYQMCIFNEKQSKKESLTKILQNPIWMQINMCDVVTENRTLTKGKGGLLIDNNR